MKKMGLILELKITKMKFNKRNAWLACMQKSSLHVGCLKGVHNSGKTELTDRTELIWLIDRPPN